MPANHCMPHTEAAKKKMSYAHRGIPLYHKRRPSKVVNGVVVYRCGKCKMFFSMDGFYKNKRTILGLTSECRSCHGETSVKSRNRENYNRQKRRSEAKRRARKAGNGGGDVSIGELGELKRFFGGACLACGSTISLQWDHIVPIAKGGEHNLSNLQRLCRKCNEKKHTIEADYRTKDQKVWVIEFKQTTPNDAKAPALAIVGSGQSLEQLDIF